MKKRAGFCRLRFGSLNQRNGRGGVFIVDLDGLNTCDGCCGGIWLFESILARSWWRQQAIATQAACHT